MQTPRDAVHSLANATAVLSATLGRAAAGLRRCDEGSLSALIVEKSEDDGMGELFGAVAVLLGRRQLTDGAEWWNVFHKQNQKPLLDQLKDLDVAKMAVSKIRKARVLLSRAKLAQPLLAHSLPPTLETLDRARSDGEFSKDEPARERSSSLQSASKEGKDVASGLLQWVASVIDYHDFALASAPRAGALALNRMELSVREKRLEYTESDEYDFYGAESVDLCASRGRFVTPLQTPAGVELLKWWRESGMDTIDSINQPGVRAALSSLLAEARLVLEDEMRRAQPCGELLQTRLAQLQCVWACILGYFWYIVQLQAGV
ncbi:hypothetical protein M885DRAFT_295133 [Pelagophyceae sp. CCMP2097]|nr:hypothetical protein M885DRAFT_295133 [Pelagophyceae sp. CCMP2097]